MRRACGSHFQEINRRPQTWESDSKSTLPRALLQFINGSVASAWSTNGRSSLPTWLKVEALRSTRPFFVAGAAAPAGSRVALTSGSAASESENERRSILAIIFLQSRGPDVVVHRRNNLANSLHHSAIICP